MKNLSTYIYGTSFVHTLDARTKILLLFVYSIALFFLHSWAGVAIFAALFFIALGVSGIGFARVSALSKPAYILVVVIVLLNSFSMDASALTNIDVLHASLANSTGLAYVSPLFFGNTPAFVYAGSFGFVPAFFERGLFYGARIILLVYASVLISSATSQNEFSCAFTQILKPFQNRKQTASLMPARAQTQAPTHPSAPTSASAPTPTTAARAQAPTPTPTPTTTQTKFSVDDIAMVASIALCFIPIVATEIYAVRNAQYSRGAAFNSGGPVARVRAWMPVMLPALISLFMRSNKLSLAMDARCYGANSIRGNLSSKNFSACDAFTCIIACALIIGICTIENVLL